MANARSDRSRLAVVAFGGNALVGDEDHLSIGDQYAMVQALAPGLVDVLEAGWRLVVTHGNGPQVGFIMRRSELARAEVAPVPLDYAVGDTQGAMGYMFAKALDNELRHRSHAREVVALVTRAVVAADDAAFARPDKPVGTFLAEDAARDCAYRFGWHVAEEPGRGWRRVVASPRPIEIVEAAVIRRLIEAEVLVVAVGGGGIPVVRTASGEEVGVEAVVDKDRASAVLAVELGADALVICTGVDRVALDFALPTQRWIDELALDEAARLLAEGQFAAGSMAPKIEALVDYLRGRPGGIGVITTPMSVAEALEGRAGTRLLG